MFTRKPIIKLISLIMTLSLLVPLCGIGTALAVGDIPAHDPSRECRILIACVDDEIKVDGVEISLYQLAILAEDGTYTIAPDYVDSGITVADITSGEITEDICRRLESYTKTKTLSPMDVNVTDTEGEALFVTSNQGYFFFMQTNSTGTANHYCTIIPGVVIAPQYNERNWIYDVYAIPKMEKYVSPIPTPTPPPVPVQTGDNSNIDMWRMLLTASISGAVGLTVIYIATALITKKKETIIDQ